MRGEGRNLSKVVYWIVGTTFVIVGFGSLRPNRKTNEVAVSAASESGILSLGPLPTSPPPIPELVAQPAPVDIHSESAVLVDVDTGTVLYAERPTEALPIASTTKLMTALLVRQYLNLNQIITVTSEEANTEGSTIHLRPGEKITVESLLYGMLLNSGNDAATALADTVAAVTNKPFVTLMNNEAAVFGMTSTHYLDPAGLDDAGRSSAEDLAIVARAVLDDPFLATVVQTQSRVVTSTDGRIVHDLTNANHLVNDIPYDGIIGFKTGFTPAAGHCLVAGSQRNGHRVIAVILRTDALTITASAIEARKLMDWGWQNILWPAQPAKK